MNNANLFFNMQRERYKMLIRRRAGEKPPWTEDKVLQKWRFCNVFREDDRTTAWFRENIREPLRDDPEKVLPATVIFRWFNRIETGEKLKPMLLKGEWDPKSVRTKLWLTQPLVTGAYMIKTPAGMNKLDGLIHCINGAVEAMPSILDRVAATPPGERSLQHTWDLLREIPFLGGFMAYEVVTDLRHTAIADEARDIMSWANAGPGCARGLGRLMNGNPDRYRDDSPAHQVAMLGIMQDLLTMSRDSDNWPDEWPSWEMREVEHGLCEFDKWCRGQGGERLKRKYP